MFCVCYACDDNYALQTGVSILSLFEHNKNIDMLDVYIFVNNVSLENKNKLIDLSFRYRRKIELIDSQAIVNRIKAMNLISNVDNNSLSTFSRLFIKDYIPNIYDYVIYIDADTMVLGDISNICSFAKEKPVAAVIDLMSQNYKRCIGFKSEEPYFNCGVLLINLKLWILLKCEERILYHILNVYNKYLYADQDIINIVLKNEIDILPLEFNTFPFYSSLQYKLIKKLLGGSCYYTENEFLKSEANKIIIHFVYSVVDRPWYMNNLNEFAPQWDSLVSKTAWQTCRKSRRKLFSRTRLLQVIYKIFGVNAVIRIVIKRNYKAFKQAEKQYINAGLNKNA